MRKILITLTLLLTATLAYAQPPAITAAQVFDRIVAQEVPCTAVDMFAEAVYAFDYAFCGYISDQMSDINTLWTREEFEADGYITVSPWARDYEVLGASQGEVWYAGFSDGRYVSVVALFVVYDVEGTAILVTFDKAN